VRINVLSEIPDEWTSAVFSFKEINKKHKKENEGKLYPSDNDEYFIYQALIGGLPMDGKPDEGFKDRFKEYLIKVVREAKVNTDWSEQNEAYEKSVIDFIENILDDQEFLNTLTPLFEMVKNYGIIYSLVQTLLKTTAPGIPDTYQGTELWDLSFVDPDNRRAVDFAQREQYLNEIGGNLNNDDYINQLISSKEDGRIKLYTLFNALKERRNHFNLFAKGEYLPLNVSGDRAENVIAFVRKWQNQWALVVVPKSIVALTDTEQFGTGMEVWGDTAISLPANAPGVWSNIFSKKSVELQQIERPIGVPEMVTSDAFMEPFVGENSVTENQLPVSEILQNFPVGLLIARQ
jgi:(1->4)-alpha-D-glucan 1-alpha-D-glucosylmutase